MFEFWLQQTETKMAEVVILLEDETNDEKLVVKDTLSVPTHHCEEISDEEIDDDEGG